MNQSKLVLLGVLSSLTLAACAPGTTGQVGKSGDSIIGGKPVEKTDKILKSIVAVYDATGGQLCTGSLLEDNIVLTAAHCITENTTMYVFFDTSLGKSSVRLPVDRFAISNYWKTRARQPKNTGDIALIHFSGQAPAEYEPAKFLTDRDTLKNGAEVVIAGFGLTNGTDKNTAGTLNMTTVSIADARFSNSEITVDQRNGTGACHGDSGGPAYVEIYGEYYLWGITSRGVADPKNDCSQFAAYTNALYYKGWIDRVSSKLIESLTNLDLLAPTAPATQQQQAAGHH